MTTETKLRPRWVAQEIWCGEDLTNYGIDWIGLRCKRFRDHAGSHSPVFDTRGFPHEDVWQQVQVIPAECVCDVERVDYIFASMERTMLWEMWKNGHAPVMPLYWEMWIEQHKYAPYPRPGEHSDWLAGDWAEAYFKVSTVGSSVVRR